MPVFGVRQLRDQSIQDVNGEILSQSQSRLENDRLDAIAFDLAVELVLVLGMRHY